MPSNAGDARRNAQLGSGDAADLVRLPRIGRCKAGFDAAAREEKAAADQVEPGRTSLGRVTPKDVDDADGSARRTITEHAKIVPLQPASDGCVEVEVPINKRKSDLVEGIHVSDGETVVAAPPAKILRISHKTKVPTGGSRGRGRGPRRGRGGGRGRGRGRGRSCEVPPPSPVGDDGHLQVETSSEDESSDGSLEWDEVDDTALYLLASVSEMVANDSDGDTRNNALLPARRTRKDVIIHGEGTSQEGGARNCTGGAPGEPDN